MPQQDLVLVVDDDEDVRISLADVLVDEGFLVTAAANGQEALNVLRSVNGRARLILLDLMMPVMDGWEFRKIQMREERLAAIPVVAVTASGLCSKAMRDLAVDGCLDKPIVVDRLLAEMHRALGRA